MFNQNTSSDTKIAVLEERLSSYEIMMRKIDEAIQIMGKTSQNISKMLAVHDEKIEQCNRDDNSILKQIDGLREENREQHTEVSERIDKIEEKIEDLTKHKWTLLGVASALAFAITIISNFASGFLIPSEIQMMTQGHTHSVQENKTADN